MRPERNDAQDIEQTKRLAAEWAEIAARSQQVFDKQLDWLAEDDGFRILHPVVVSKAFIDLAARALADPWTMVGRQLAYWSDLALLSWHATERLIAGKDVPPVIEPAPDDRRFKDPGWTENLACDVAKQAYLLTVSHVQTALRQVDGLDSHATRKVLFYVRQYLDALSPSNFAATNPEVIRATIDSRGENLILGMANLLDDLNRGGGGHVNLKLTNPDAFRVGETLATTPGKVVFQNAMMQLVQYAPSTDAHRRRPLLIVPPWINKFYVLDLRPQNSFIKWAVDQGHTVFLISWVNPDRSMADTRFDEYLLQGPLAALDVVRQATGESEVNAIGYCIGGTLLAMTLAYLAHAGSPRIASATFLTSLLDFSDVGELSVFIDEEQIELMEQHMQRRGYLEAHHLADAFSLLRENELIWSFVVKNYLLGRQPMPFDILYWNSDSTHMPAAMHSFYLRNMYLENRLKLPGGITLAGAPIDLSAVRVPAYFLSTREDHIAPWKTTYLGTRLLSGPVRFVLAGSGHIAGVINPPAANKYGYWTNDVIAGDADSWLAGAAKHDGSWWPDWDRWVSQFASDSVPARSPGGGGLAAIEDAPGSYVKVRRT